MRVHSPLTGRLSVPWNSQHHQHPHVHRRGRSIALFFITFLATFCILVMHTSVSYPEAAGNNLLPDTFTDESKAETGTTAQRLPQCIIIGARKCGTRALLEFLSIHSRVQIAKDEVHFFDEDNKYSLGLDWYRQQMPYSEPDQVTIEKTPAYFVTDDAVQRIRQMNSSIKLIVIVRDPVTRLVSDYAQLNANKLAKGEKPLRSFEQMVLLPNGDVDINYKPVRSSIYSIYFARWTEVFSSHQILLVDGDRLIYEPFAEMQRVEQFLSLEHEISRDHFAFNDTKGFFCIQIPGSSAYRCLNDTKGRRHPDVDPSVIQLLRKFYAPFNQQFYLMVGKDFMWPEE